MKIQMVDLKGQYQKIKEEVNQAIQDVLDSAAFINGPAVNEFSQNLSTYLGGIHVIPCANGTDAIQIALMALGLKPGDEVILPVHTYVATAEVIALLNLKPIFVDVDPDSFTMDITEIESKINSRTKAIVPVHLYGQCAEMEELIILAKKHNLVVIEDTAQAIGAEYTFSNGEKCYAGTMGDIGTSSFFPSKNLGCYGDGGAMFVKDKELAEKCRMIANHGQRIKYHHDLIGCNSRLDTIQAAILNVKLKYLSDYCAARQNAANLYDELLKDCKLVSIPTRSKDSTHVFHQYTLKIDKKIDRDKVQTKLKEQGIPSMIYYPVPLHQQKAYVDPKQNSFPVTEELSKTVLSLPIHTEITKEEQEFIIVKLIDILKSS